MNSKYEYKIITLPRVDGSDVAIKQLNDLGEYSWELVQVTENQMGFVCFLKRKK